MAHYSVVACPVWVLPTSVFIISLFEFSSIKFKKQMPKILYFTNHFLLKMQHYLDFDVKLIRTVSNAKKKKKLKANTSSLSITFPCSYNFGYFGQVFG